MPAQDTAAGDLSSMLDADKAPVKHTDNCQVQAQTQASRQADRQPTPTLDGGLYDMPRPDSPGHYDQQHNNQAFRPVQSHSQQSSHPSAVPAAEHVRPPVRIRQSHPAAAAMTAARPAKDAQQQQQARSGSASAGTATGTPQRAQRADLQRVGRVDQMRTGTPSPSTTCNSSSSNDDSGSSSSSSSGDDEDVPLLVAHRNGTTASKTHGSSQAGTSAGHAAPSQVRLQPDNSDSAVPTLLPVLCGTSNGFLVTRNGPKKLFLLGDKFMPGYKFEEACGRGASKTWKKTVRVNQEGPFKGSPIIDWLRAHEQHLPQLAKVIAGKKRKAGGTGAASQANAGSSAVSPGSAAKKRKAADQQQEQAAKKPNAGASRKDGQASGGCKQQQGRGRSPGQSTPPSVARGQSRFGADSGSSGQQTRSSSGRPKQSRKRSRFSRNSSEEDDDPNYEETDANTEESDEDGSGESAVSSSSSSSSSDDSGDSMSSLGDEVGKGGEGQEAGRDGEQEQKEEGDEEGQAGPSTDTAHQRMEKAASRAIRDAYKAAVQQPMNVKTWTNGWQLTLPRQDSRDGLTWQQLVNMWEAAGSPQTATCKHLYIEGRLTVISVLVHGLLDAPSQAHNAPTAVWHPALPQAIPSKRSKQQNQHADQVAAGGSAPTGAAGPSGVKAKSQVKERTGDASHKAGQQTAKQQQQGRQAGQVSGSGMRSVALAPDNDLGGVFGADDVLPGRPHAGSSGPGSAFATPAGQAEGDRAFRGMGLGPAGPSGLGARRGSQPLGSGLDGSPQGQPQKLNQTGSGMLSGRPPAPQRSRSVDNTAARGAAGRGGTSRGAAASGSRPAPRGAGLSQGASGGSGELGLFDDLNDDDRPAARAGRPPAPSRAGPAGRGARGGSTSRGGRAGTSGAAGRGAARPMNPPAPTSSQVQRAGRLQHMDATQPPVTLSNGTGSSPPTPGAANRQARPANAAGAPLGNRQNSASSLGRQGSGGGGAGAGAGPSTQRGGGAQANPLAQAQDINRSFETQTQRERDGALHKHAQRYADALAEQLPAYEYELNHFDMYGGQSLSITTSARIKELYEAEYPLTDNGKLDIFLLHDLLRGGKIFSNEATWTGEDGETPSLGRAGEVVTRQEYRKLIEAVQYFIRNGRLPPPELQPAPSGLQPEGPSGNHPGPSPLSPRPYSSDRGPSPYNPPSPSRGGVRSPGHDRPPSADRRGPAGPSPGRSPGRHGPHPGRSPGRHGRGGGGAPWEGPTPPPGPQASHGRAFGTGGLGAGGAPNGGGARRGEGWPGHGMGPGGGFPTGMHNGPRQPDLGARAMPEQGPAQAPWQPPPQDQHMAGNDSDASSGPPVFQADDVDTAHGPQAAAASSQRLAPPGRQQQPPQPSVRAPSHGNSTAAGPSGVSASASASGSRPAAPTHGVHPASMGLHLEGVGIHMPQSAGWPMPQAPQAQPPQPPPLFQQAFLATALGAAPTIVQAAPTVDIAATTTLLQNVYNQALQQVQQQQQQPQGTENATAPAPAAVITSSAEAHASVAAGTAVEPSPADTAPGKSNVLELRVLRPSQFFMAPGRTRPAEAPPPGDEGVPAALLAVEVDLVDEDEDEDLRRGQVDMEVDDDQIAAPAAATLPSQPNLLPPGFTQPPQANAPSTALPPALPATLAPEPPAPPPPTSTAPQPPAPPPPTSQAPTMSASQQPTGPSAPPAAMLQPTPVPPPPPHTTSAPQPPAVSPAPPTMVQQTQAPPPPPAPSINQQMPAPPPPIPPLPPAYVVPPPPPPNLSHAQTVPPPPPAATVAQLQARLVAAAISSAAPSASMEQQLPPSPFALPTAAPPAAIAGSSSHAPQPSHMPPMYPPLPSQSLSSEPSSPPLFCPSPPASPPRPPLPSHDSPPPLPAPLPPEGVAYPLPVAGAQPPQAVAGMQGIQRARLPHVVQQPPGQGLHQPAQPAFVQQPPGQDPHQPMQPLNGQLPVQLHEEAPPVPPAAHHPVAGAADLQEEVVDEDEEGIPAELLQAAFGVHSANCLELQATGAAHDDEVAAAIAQAVHLESIGHRAQAVHILRELRDSNKVVLLQGEQAQPPEAQPEPHPAVLPVMEGVQQQVPMHFAPPEPGFVPGYIPPPPQAHMQLPPHAHMPPPGDMLLAPGLAQLAPHMQLPPHQQQHPHVQPGFQDGVPPFPVLGPQGLPLWHEHPAGFQPQPPMPVPNLDVLMQQAELPPGFPPGFPLQPGLQQPGAPPGMLFEGHPQQLQLPPGFALPPELQHAAAAAPGNHAQGQQQQFPFPPGFPAGAELGQFPQQGPVDGFNFGQQ